MRHITLIDVRTGAVEFSASAESVRHAVLASAMGWLVRTVFGGDPVVVHIGSDEIPDDKIAVFDVHHDLADMVWTGKPVGRVALGRVFSLPRDVVPC